MSPTESSSSPVAALLDGGAVLPPSSVPVGEPRTDSIEARRYHHPALGDRPVVRLVGATVGAAEDGALGFLGFAEPDAVTEVGVGRRRGLGFPGWALVNAPEHARLALGVVKDFEQASRLAATKPGHAKDAFDAIARTIGDQAPVLLPSLMEQAARAFVDGGNPRLAGTMFERAREAERVHALVVDEAARRDAFLEFAFAGALTVRSLTDHAATLRDRYDPAEAHEELRELLLRRTLGGLPPWTGTAKELRAMAKAAGLDGGAEDRHLLKALLRAPATARATSGFWKPYEAALVRLLRDEPEVAGWARDLFPRNDGDGFDGWWLDQLEAGGALDPLAAPADAPAASPLGAPAAWLSRIVAHCTPRWGKRLPPPQLLHVIELLAPRLVADGVAVVPWSGHIVADVNVLDALVHHGVPLPAFGERTVTLTNWFEAAAAGIQRDLAAVAADPRFADGLARGMVQYGSGYTQRKVDELLTSPGLRPFVTRWLSQKAERFGAFGLSQAAEDLALLDGATSRSTFATVADVHPVLARASLRGALARTLVGGLVDELGWPALEQAVAQLAPQEVCLAGAWPWLVVHDRARALVVGPDAIVTGHDLRLPTALSAHATIAVRYVGGQFLVAWSGSDQRAYWSEAADDTFALSTPYRSTSTCIWRPNGSCSFGGRPVHAGDHSFTDQAEVVSDGTTTWRQEWEQGPGPDGHWRQLHSLREYDPDTGTRGRTSLPAFLEEFAPADGEVLVVGSSLLPADGRLVSSPLGFRSGFVGTRVRRRVQPDGRAVIDVQSIDGTSATVPTELGVPVALVKLPGHEDRPLVLTDAALWDHTGTVRLGWARAGDLRPNTSGVPGRSDNPRAGGFHPGGTDVVPPAAHWHLLQARDVAGSLALRGLTDAVAGQLLEAGLADIEAGDTSHTNVRASVAKRLPAIGHPRLLAGVTAVVADAARVQRDLDRFVAGRDPSAVADTIDLEDVTERSLDGLADLGIARFGSYGSHDGRPAHQLVAVGQFLAVTLTPEALVADLPSTSLQWYELVGRIRAVAHRATSPLLDESARAGLLRYLEVWATTPFTGDLGTLRVGSVAGLDAQVGVNGNGRFLVIDKGDFRYIRDQAIRTFFEVRGGLPRATHVDAVRTPGADWTPAQIHAFVAEARSRGPVPVDPEAVTELQRLTGMTRPEAALVLGGLPGIDSWEANFVDGPTREALGIKLAEAKAVRDTLKALPAAVRLDLLAATVGREPADRWTPLGTGPGDPDSPIAAVASVWNAAVGRRAALPEEAVAAAKGVTALVPPTTWLGWFADPGTDSALHHDGRSVVVQGTHEVDVETTGENPFGYAELAVVAHAVPWLFARPVGDPLRDGIGPVLALVRQRLANPHLVTLVGGAYGNAEAAAALLERLGTTPINGFERANSRDNGTFLAWVGTWGRVRAWVRPAAFGADTDTSVVDGLDAPYQFGHNPLRVLTDVLHGARFDAFAARVATTPVPPGGYEADPSASVPALVADAVAHHSVSPDAAALLLQLLALHDPTDRNVRTWNGWTPARHKKAQAELAAAKLVLEAKRARAGRSAFLPGGWVTAATPNLPLEAWKLEGYELVLNDSGKPLSPYDHITALHPHHLLFARAWQRVLDGDGPGTIA